MLVQHSLGNLGEKNFTLNLVLQMEHLSCSRDPLLPSILECVLNMKKSLSPQISFFFLLVNPLVIESPHKIFSLWRTPSLICICHKKDLISDVQRLRDVLLPSSRQITSQPRYQGTVTTFGFTVTRWLSSRNKV